MQKYRGRYIDNVIYTSKAEIDAAIKEDAKQAYINALRIFERRGTMEASAFCTDRAQRMNQLGYTWEEIEEIEIETFKEA